MDDFGQGEESGLMARWGPITHRELIHGLKNLPPQADTARTSMSVTPQEEMPAGSSRAWTFRCFRAPAREAHRRLASPLPDWGQDTARTKNLSRRARTPF